MPSTSDSPEPRLAVSREYRFVRALIRIWLALNSRSIRLLRGGVLPASGPALLVLNHPLGFLDALVLVAAFERQVHCLVNSKVLQGYLRGWLGRHLSIVSCESEAAGWSARMPVVAGLLERGEAVVLGAEAPGAGVGERLPVALAASTLALEAEPRHSGELRLAIFPVCTLFPHGRSRARELLVYVSNPLSPQQFLSAGGAELSAQARNLAMALEEVFRRNVFSLHAEELRQFLSDLEETLRAALEENWAARPDWKQKVEGFELSQFLAEWAEQLNCSDPARLLALREFLDECREARRRGALRQFEVEAAGAWLKSRWRRVWCWIESVVGLPVALYGLINHLLAWVLLFWRGLLKKGSEPDEHRQWLIRTLVVLGCYVAQVMLCAHWLGRATAGYYVLTLPLSGAYMWRYWSLLRNRTRLLFLSARLPAEGTKLRRRREKLLQEINTARDAYAEALGIPH